MPGWLDAYAPPGDGPFPAILLLHGSEGAWSLWSFRNAAILAAHGYLALPFGYSVGGSPWHAGRISNVPIDATARALDMLRGCRLGTGRVGVYGMSRGAEHALLLAMLLARDGREAPDAVVAHSPPDTIHAAFDPSLEDAEMWDRHAPAWTWRGSPDLLRPTTPIEIEHYGGPLFLSYGTQDEVWPSDMVPRLARRLALAGRSAEIHAYKGSGHGPSGDAETEHHTRLIEFFDRHLKS